MSDRRGVERDASVNSVTRGDSRVRRSGTGVMTVTA